MALAVTLVLAFALLIGTVLIHYEVLRATLALLPRLPVRPRTRILVAIAAIFVAHLLEIALYAAVFYGMEHHLTLGSISGDFDGSWLDYLYFSSTSYTTLGVGDVAPHGMLRMISGVEGLNGLVLIGWSASFTYVVMQNYWERDGR